MYFVFLVCFSDKAQKEGTILVGQRQTKTTDMCLMARLKHCGAGIYYKYASYDDGFAQNHCVSAVATKQLNYFNN